LIEEDQLESSPRTPLFYPEGASRDWSKPSSERTQRTLGFEITIDLELRRQYFEDMKAENERLEREIFRDAANW